MPSLQGMEAEINLRRAKKDKEVGEKSEGGGAKKQRKRRKSSGHPGKIPE